MRRIVLTLLTLALVGDVAEAAIACRSSPERGDGYWSYRLIDNRKCWSKGRQDKRNLYWERSPPVRGRNVASKPVPNAVRVRVRSGEFDSPNRDQTPSERDERDVLETSIWPPLTDEPSFKERWNGK